MNKRKLENLLASMVEKISVMEWYIEGQDNRLSLQRQKINQLERQQNRHMIRLSDLERRTTDVNDERSNVGEVKKVASDVERGTLDDAPSRGGVSEGSEQDGAKCGCDACRIRRGENLDHAERSILASIIDELPPSLLGFVFGGLLRDDEQPRGEGRKPETTSPIQ